MTRHFDSLGTIYRGFRLARIHAIEELQCVLREWVHEATGAQVLHLASDDPENLFCLSFQTRPTKSDGVAHILEHTVLCGSEKYPVKDPFFAMTRRSLNTFMNALTGADFTCYPAASQIKKDFYQLLDVYLDAVFHPKLLEKSFRQEGHRLEFREPQDPTSPLEYRGIVFNEMKGALNSAMSRLSEAISESLFPDLTYGCNSGGDPKVIPQLTYAQLKDFHQAYYHPSRCLFFFYGDLPLEGHLDFLAEHCLERTSPAAPLSPLPLQPRFRAPVYRTLSYPATIEEQGERSYIAFAWLTCSILEQEELLALSCLDTILMETDASPLRMALLKSGLCKQAHSALEGEISEIPWTFVLRGCLGENADALEKVFRETVSSLIKTGFSADVIESALHQMEIQRSEITGDSAPFGLSLFWRCALLKQHGGKPEDGLVIHALFKRLREKIAQDPAYLPSLLDRYLLKNPHFVRIVLNPDPELTAREGAEERAQLDALAASLASEKREELVREATELAAFQEEQENQALDILPTLTLQDVPQQARDYPLEMERVGGVEIYRHSCFTNQIVYADFIMDLPQLSLRELPYVRLLTRLLSEMGSGGRDYRATLETIQASTGGIDAALAVHLQAKECGRFFPSLHIRGKALYRNGAALFQLLKETATSVDLTDKVRLRESVLKHHSALESGLNQNAMRYATNLSASAFGGASRLNSLWYGLEYFWAVRDLARDFDARVDLLIQELQELQQRILHLKGLKLVLGCDEEYYQHLKKQEFYGLQQWTQAAPSFIPWSAPLPELKVEPQGRLIASQVAFSAQVFPVVGYCHEQAAALGLAAHLMENQVLHSRIRERGGAYGGGAVNNPMPGQFYFFAYRDPHVASTLEAFDEAIKDIAEGEFEDQDLEEAKLEMIQDLDAPVAPGSRAALAYGWKMAGKTLAVRQGNRDRILRATREDIQKAVKQVILPNRHLGSLVVFSGRELLEKENATLKAQGKSVLALEKI